MIITLNEASFQQEVVSAKGLVVIDFWAPWCGPCKMLSPVIDEIAAEYGDKIKVCKLNTDENMSLSAQFQISSIPCVMFFKGGTAVEKFVGFKNKADIKKTIDGLL